MLSLGQAALQVGRTKTALTKAIKSGRLSATRNDQGHYCIDPAELFRAYPVNAGRHQPEGQPECQGLRQETPKEIELLHQQITHLKEILTHRDDVVADLRKERDKLLSVVEEQAETVRQLTYQKGQTTEPSKGGLLSWLLK